MACYAVESVYNMKQYNMILLTEFIPVKIALDISGSPLKFNGAIGNIQGNLTPLRTAMPKELYR